MSKNKKRRLVEFDKMTRDIRRNKEYQKLKKYVHHGGTNTLYQHSISVAYIVFVLCLIFKINKKIMYSAVIAALLHDFFGYSWRDKNSEYSKNIRNSKGIKRITNMHAFSHGPEAVKNSELYFVLSENQKDAIRKHMFPLYPIPPMHMEGWLVTIADKIVATRECFLTFLGWFRIRKKVYKSKRNEYIVVKV